MGHSTSPEVPNVAPRKSVERTSVLNGTHLALTALAAVISPPLAIAGVAAYGVK